MSPIDGAILPQLQPCDQMAQSRAAALGGERESGPGLHSNVHESGAGETMQPGELDTESEGPASESRKSGAMQSEPAEPRSARSATKRAVTQRQVDANPRPAKLRPRQRLGKYRLQRRLGSGAFAEVWQAHDTLEDIRVALKIPHPHAVDDELLDTFRKEVRTVAKLEHENILPVKTADMIDGLLVICHPLGTGTLSDLRGSRLSSERMLSYGEQVLAALAHAHGKKVIHCDVKPENMLTFTGDRLRICDFGIAKISQLTHVSGSGSGTVGYLAPEQALGFPSFRSDVFCAGLVLYEFFTGKLPRFPFKWPPPAADSLRRRIGPEMLDVLRRALEPDPRRRFKDAGPMLVAYRAAQRAALLKRTRARRKARRKKGAASTEGHWRIVRVKQCKQRFGRVLALRHECTRCGNPVSEAMTCCPWCGTSRKVHRGPSDSPARCPRCRRGRKLDWRSCGYCFGAGFDEVADRRYSDRRYESRCNHCREPLFPFLRYCPWCRRKVDRRWRIAEVNQRCQSCGWGVLRDFWRHCPWCSKKLSQE